MESLERSNDEIGKIWEADDEILNRVPQKVIFEE